MSHKFKPEYLAIALLLVFSAAVFAAITVTVDPLGSTSAGVDILVPIDQRNGAVKVNKITYNSDVLFNVPNANFRYKINPSAGTANVEFTPINASKHSSFEIWALTESEAASFNTWTDAKKDQSREYQFILAQGGSVSSLSANLPGLIDQTIKSNETCESKYLAWVGNAITPCQGADPPGWKELTFQKFYAFILDENKRGPSNLLRFYVVVENSSSTGSPIKWEDSVPIPVNVGDVFHIKSAPAISQGTCSTVPECLARTDLKFVEQVFKKKNPTEVSVSGWHENIIATTFSSVGGKPSATGVLCSGNANDSTGKCLALPNRSALGKNVQICFGSKCVTQIVNDLGPWCITDPYINNPSARPYAEINKGKVLTNNPYQCNTSLASNGAGIDVTPNIAKELGFDGKAVVKWRFV